MANSTTTSHEKAVEALRALDGEVASLQATAAEANAATARLGQERNALWAVFDEKREPRKRKLDDEQREAAAVRTEQLDDEITSEARRAAQAVARLRELGPVLLSARRLVDDTAAEVPLAVATASLDAAQRGVNGARRVRDEIEGERNALINAGELVASIDLSARRRDAAVALLQANGVLLAAQVVHAGALLTAAADAITSAENATRAAEQAILDAERERLAALEQARTAQNQCAWQRSVVQTAEEDLARYRDGLPDALAAVQREALSV